MVVLIRLKCISTLKLKLVVLHVRTQDYLGYTDDPRFIDTTLRRMKNIASNLKKYDKYKNKRSVDK